MPKPVIKRIYIDATPDDESYQQCKEYLGEFTDRTGDGYYLDRSKGQFLGPHVPWEQASQSLRDEYLKNAREYVAQDVYPQSQPDVTPEVFEAAVLAEAQTRYGDDRPGEVLASKCSANGTSRSFDFVVPAQHLPHSPSNWNHVPPAEIAESFKVNAEEFAKLGIEPVVTEARSMAFWLDVLAAVQDCECVEAHERGDWCHHVVKAVATLELDAGAVSPMLPKGASDLARSSAKAFGPFTATVETTPVGGVDVNPNDASVTIAQRAAVARDHLDELSGLLQERGFTVKAINAAIKEHLGADFLPDNARQAHLPAPLPEAKSNQSGASR